MGRKNADSLKQGDKMLPQVPIIRVTDSEKVPMPSYSDGVGTCVTLRSNEMKSIKIAPQHFEVFSTGFAIALPMGMEAQIRSLKESTKTGVIVLNAPATIDASDRKEIKVCIYNASQESFIIKQGDPIALMVFSLALRVQWTYLTQNGNEIQNNAGAQTQTDDQSFVPLREYTINTPKTTSQQPNEQVDDLNAKDIIQPIIRPDATEQTENDIISDENPLAEDPVPPPDILEEFEKIESDFGNKTSEGND